MDSRDNTFHVTEREGSTLVTLPNEPELDGVMILSTSDERKVLWVSQCKNRTVNTQTELIADKAEYDGTIETNILPMMREAVRQLKDREKLNHDTIVVYDIFSNRKGPQDKGKPYSLEKNEVIFVTTDDALDSVLGGFAARKRPIRN